MTTKPIHSLVSQVMAGVATPLLIVEGSASAHTFTLKPSAARAIAASGVFVRVSETTEPFTRKLIEGLPPSVRVLTLSDDAPGVRLLEQRTAGAFEAHVHEADEHGADARRALEDHEAHGEEEAHQGARDGHIWLDPDNAAAIVHAVAKVLADKWPQHKLAFQANAAAAALRIAEKAKEIEASLLPIKGRPFIVFHDAYQYFETRFGLAAAGAITLSPDHPPSAKRLTEVRQKIRDLDARCIFAEPGFQPKLLAAVSEGTKARTGMLDPEGQSLEPGPGLYEELLGNLARNLAECLSEKD